MNDPSANVETKVIEHGEASRMPDTSWTWRRLLIFGACLVASGLMFWAFWIVQKVALGQLQVIPQVLGFLISAVRWGFYTLWLGLTLYGVGATVTDVAKLFAAMKTTRKETIMQGPAPGTATPAKVESDGPQAAPPASE